MKQFLLSFIMAGCMVGNLAAQELELDDGGDIDDPALEEALKEAFKKAEEETATQQHSNKEN